MDALICHQTILLMPVMSCLFTTLLFNAILVHGALPDNFLRSTIVPIPKGRNADGSNSNNYRGIALSSIFGKLMENIVLIKFSNQLQTSSL